MENEKKMLQLIGRRIREFRYSKDLEQIDLEQLIEGKISRSCISYFENGKRAPSLKSLFNLAEALQVEPIMFMLDPRKDGRHRLIESLISIPDEDLQKIESEIEDLYLKAERQPDHPPHLRRRTA